MRIGIIGAINEEIIQLKNIMTLESKENISDFTYYIGKIENKKIVLIESGIGKVNLAFISPFLLIFLFIITQI
ncbi:MAG: hypothetical protein ACRC0S_08370 [Fusobacteriaceae bacterium]